MPLAAGDQLADYKILRVVGQGGMGAVYQAQSSDGSLYAIKEMVVDIRDPYQRRRAVDLFASEAALLGQLDHPKLVKSHEFFSVGDSHFMVMDFVSGQTLSQLLDSRPGLPTHSEVLDWADQICEALQYLHGRDPMIVFRDLKPGNVMLDEGGGIHLIDFGIARVFEDEAHTNTFIKGVGSKGFAPIEQYGSGGTDVRTDVYSLGATLYNLLTGQKPPASVGMLAGNERLEPIRVFNPEVPPELERIVLCSMALKKESRPASIAQMREMLARVGRPGEQTEDFDLEAVLRATRPGEGEEPDETVVSAPARAPRRSRKVALTLLPLIVGIGLASLLSSRGSNKIATAPQPPRQEWIPIGADIAWRYYDQGTDQKKAWRELGFDDSAWKSGMPRFGYGDPVTTVLGYGPDPDKKYLTSYFRKTFPLQDASTLAGAQVRLRVIRDDGAIIWINGQEVLRSNLPEGEVDCKTRATKSIGGAEESVYLSASINPALLKSGQNLIAAEIHQNDIDSSDLTFEAILEFQPKN